MFKYVKKLHVMGSQTMFKYVKKLHSDIRKVQFM
jgi:hypothetical protein